MLSFANKVRKFQPLDGWLSYVYITQKNEFFSKSDFCKYQESEWYQNSI